MFHAGALSDQARGPRSLSWRPVARARRRSCAPWAAAGATSPTRPSACGADRVIEPYCKPLSVRRPELGGPEGRDVPARTRSLVPQVTPWLAGMVVLRRDLDPGAPVVVEEVDPLDALVMLGPETSSLARLERPLQSWPGCWTRSAGSVSSATTTQWTSSRSCATSWRRCDDRTRRGARRAGRRTRRVTVVGGPSYRLRWSTARRRHRCHGATGPPAESCDSHSLGARSWRPSATAPRWRARGRRCVSGSALRRKGTCRRSCALRCETLGPTQGRSEGHEADIRR